MYVFLTPLFHLWDDDISPFTILVQLTSILTQKEYSNHFFALNKSCRARKNEAVWDFTSQNYDVYVNSTHFVHIERFMSSSFAIFYV